MYTESPLGHLTKVHCQKQRRAPNAKHKNAFDFVVEPQLLKLFLWEAQSGFQYTV